MGSAVDIRTNLELEQPESAVQAAGARGRTIIRTSLVGILANVGLASLKAVIGLLSHSIAIVMDAVNNLSDAASSVITIVGTRLARKQPDRKHPFGHGRIEYLSALIISILVLYAGITSLTESVKAILNPETPDYSTVSLILIAVGVVVKIMLGRYVKSVGEKVNSDSLVDSGKDALLDSVISASTLVAAAVFLLTGLSTEAWLGAVISLLIIRSGISMLRETLSRLLGERAEPELARAIKATVLSFPGVSGAYDLVLNNYGPDTYNGSIHIEVPDTFTAAELDELIRQITLAVYQNHRVVLTAIGVYSINTRDESSAGMREKIREVALASEYALEMHGFYVKEDPRSIRFDVVISFDAPDRRAVYQEICDAVKKLYPDYELSVALDSDFSEP